MSDSSGQPEPQKQICFRQLVSIGPPWGLANGLTWNLGKRGWSVAKSRCHGRRSGMDLESREQHSPGAVQIVDLYHGRLSGRFEDYRAGPPSHAISASMSHAAACYPSLRFLHTCPSGNRLRNWRSTGFHLLIAAVNNLDTQFNWLARPEILKPARVFRNQVEFDCVRSGFWWHLDRNRYRLTFTRSNI